jgi:FAD/FMN-containing dehydrogenase
MHFIHTIALLLASTSLTLADVNSTGRICRALARALPTSVFQPSDPEYKAEQARYWNIGLSADVPRCIVLPSTASAVSTAIKILRTDDNVDFAVKSGGHDPNPGHSAIDGGVLIALSHLNGTTYNATENVAYVRPGGTWSDVLHALQPYNVAVVGGRLGEHIVSRSWTRMWTDK